MALRSSDVKLLSVITHSQSWSRLIAICFRLAGEHKLRLGSGRDSHVQITGAQEHKTKLRTRTQGGSSGLKKRPSFEYLAARAYFEHLD